MMGAITDLSAEASGLFFLYRNRHIMASKSKTGRWVIILAVIGSAGLIGSVVATVMLAKDQSSLPEYDGEWTAGDAKFDVVIRSVDRPAAVVAGEVNGESVMVRCDTCHAGKEPNRLIASGDELDEFHNGLVFDHGRGSLTCLTCHNSEDYETLKKPDGLAVSFGDSMQLCAQCHGPQYRDYQGGSHGGMTGHWDLQRGGRERNHCIDCHDPHSPAFRKMMPMPPPKVRAGTQPTGGGHH